MHQHGAAIHLHKIFRVLFTCTLGMLFFYYDSIFCESGGFQFTKLPSEQQMIKPLLLVGICF